MSYKNEGPKESFRVRRLRAQLAKLDREIKEAEWRIELYKDNSTKDRRRLWETINLVQEARNKLIKQRHTKEAEYLEAIAA